MIRAIRLFVGSGWGITSLSGIFMPLNLQYGIERTLSHADCLKQVGPITAMHVHPNYTLCAKDNDVGVGICFGDSGKSKGGIVSISGLRLRSFTVFLLKFKQEVLWWM